MSIVDADIQPLSFIFGDDGLVPNNPMPLLVYKRAIALDTDHPEATIEKLFGANGWGAMWRNGVYDYLHYHATVHEVLGVARGNARGALRRRPRHRGCDRSRRRRHPARRHRPSMPVRQP